MAAPEMPSAIRQKRALAFFGRFAGIERVDRVRSGEPQLPHMPDVEEPGFRARVEVLIEDAEGYCTGISKPAKGTIFGAKGEMERVERGPLEWCRGGSKGRSVLPAAVLLPESFRGGCSFGPAPSRGGAYSAACSAPAGPGGQSQVSVLPGSPAVPRCFASYADWVPCSADLIPCSIA